MTEWHVFQAVEKATQEAIAREANEYRSELDTATELMRLAYNGAGLCNGSSSSLPFSKSVFRWSYAYRYATSHTYMVLKALNRFWDLTSDLNWWLNGLNEHECRVCCIGGGPGSDLLGVSLFLHQHKIMSIFGNVLDEWTEWKDTYLEIAANFNPRPLCLPGCGKVQYWRFDFNQTYTWTKQVQCIQNADLVTMVKFVSAVASDYATCRTHLTMLLQYMKDGAMLFALDNGANELFELINDAAAAAGLHQINQIKYKKGLQLPQHEKDAIDASTLRLAGLKPMKNSVVTACLWQKAPSTGGLGKILKANALSNSQTSQNQQIQSKDSADTTTSKLRQDLVQMLTSQTKKTTHPPNALALGPVSGMTPSTSAPTESSFTSFQLSDLVDSLVITKSKKKKKSSSTSQHSSDANLPIADSSRSVGVSAGGSAVGGSAGESNLISSSKASVMSTTGTSNVTPILTKIDHLPQRVAFNLPSTISEKKPVRTSEGKISSTTNSLHQPSGLPTSKSTSTSVGTQTTKTPTKNVSTMTPTPSLNASLLTDTFPFDSFMLHVHDQWKQTPAQNSAQRSSMHVEKSLSLRHQGYNNRPALDASRSASASLEEDAIDDQQIPITKPANSIINLHKDENDSALCDSDLTSSQLNPRSENVKKKRQRSKSKKTLPDSFSTLSEESPLAVTFPGRKPLTSFSPTETHFDDGKHIGTKLQIESVPSNLLGCVTAQDDEPNVKHEEQESLGTNGSRAENQEEKNFKNAQDQTTFSIISTIHSTNAQSATVPRIVISNTCKTNSQEFPTNFGLSRQEAIRTSSTTHGILNTLFITGMCGVLGIMVYRRYFQS